MAAEQRQCRPVRVTRLIRAPAHEVWTAIATPGYLERVHPFCERNPVTSWPGADAHDEVHYRSGWVYHRHFTDWLDGVGYDLDIGTAGEPTSRVGWRIEPRDGAACSLTIAVWPRRLTGIPVLGSLAYLLVLRPMLRRYLMSMVQGVQWFLVHREPVAEDQFGAHARFSRRG